MVVETPLHAKDVQIPPHTAIHCSQAMVFHTQELHTEPGSHAQDGFKEAVPMLESWGQTQDGSHLALCLLLQWVTGRAMEGTGWAISIPGPTIERDHSS